MAPLVGDPLFAYGLLFSTSGDAEAVHGTCFGYNSPDTYLTALHCVDGVSGLQIAQQPRGTRRDFTRKVIDITAHDSADLAVLHVEPDHEAAHYYFTEIENSKQLFLGHDVHAYGYAANDPGDDALTTPRYFRGYFQRFVGTYRAPTGHAYLAGELSFPAPPGLSGAAVFKLRRLFAMLTGIVTGNSEIVRGAGYEEEIDRRPDGSTRTIQRIQVTSFGMALILGEYADWLMEVCPPLDVQGSTPSMPVPD
jgi:hypothetical protein